MHIIVTHENADFDAIASLLAAALLFPEAIPLLPNTLNRNVGDFVTLYESHFPFKRYRDLGSEPITQITLVDSQHLLALKQIAPDVTIRAIDHHEPQDALPRDADLTLVETGANVSYLIEQLMQAAKPLSAIHATLLLLGIYEDTGSLTYPNTTPRDLQSAAWLLSHGQADLDTLREYLNYPLNEPQRALYEQLINNLSITSIKGHSVMIALGEVPHYVEEISSLAHRLRDLYQPDALFLLVYLSDHIQMVARSGTDDIDVGDIAEQLGGGGHPRAAAALLKDQTLEAARHALLDLLQQTARPATTVAQMMSRGVRTFAPTDSIRHAAQMMTRYGHEGFPVVEAGRVVGILSRREVDKALRHKLEGAAISQFMTRGEFFVTPTDSIDAVQDVMTTHKIGQVPVYDRLDGELIGIVTRTDLINRWQRLTEEKMPQTNLATALEAMLSPPLLAILRQAGEIAIAQGDTLYSVGGFVRDLLLTTKLADSAEARAKTSPRFDLDLVVEGQAIKLAEKLATQFGGYVHSHKRFGTAKWVLAEPLPFGPRDDGVFLASLDFVTARTEFYRHPSALPEVEQSSIRQDLHRRDFTINTLALRLTPKHYGELLDFYGGQNDLEARLIRVLHSFSFVEDPTRMLRAGRLLARLDFSLEARTAELLNNARSLLNRVSGERITSELELAFKEADPAKTLRQFDVMGLLEAIHPGLLADAWLTERVMLLHEGLHQTPWSEMRPQPVHYLGLLAFWLAGDELAAFGERLNLRNEQRATLAQMHRLRRSSSRIAQAEQASTLYHLLAGSSDEARMLAWLGSDREVVRQQIIRYETELIHVKPEIDGGYLKREFDLEPGPIYGEILAALRDARLDGVATSLEAEHALVAGMIAEDGGGKKT